jgi:hypothetical protein
MDTAQLQQIADSLVKTYGHEIARDGDWWHGIDGHDFNIFQDNSVEQAEALKRDEDYEADPASIPYIVTVYPHSEASGTDYSQWINLQPVYIKGE